MRFLLLLVLAVSAPAAQISTFAGTGVKGFSGDGGPAASAQLNNPFGLARGPDGALYICDTDNQRVRKVTPDGLITTVAGNGARGSSGDGGPAIAAALNEPYEVRFDRAGNIFFVERLNHCVRRVDAQSGLISTVAGIGGKEGFAGDGGPATNALFKQPHSLGFDDEGDLYVCDLGNHRIRRIEMASGVISTWAGTGEKKATPEGKFAFGDRVPLHGPRALDFRHGGLILALREGNAVYAFGMTTRIVHRIAGTGKSGFTGNGGPAVEATLSGPKGVSAAPTGEIYLADTESHSIRKITVNGRIELVAGTGKKGDGPDGAPLDCQLARPHGVFVDKDGAVFIGDSENHRVRVLR